MSDKDFWESVGFVVKGLSEAAHKASYAVGFGAGGFGLSLYLTSYLSIAGTPALLISMSSFFILARIGRAMDEYSDNTANKKKSKQVDIGGYEQRTLPSSLIYDYNSALVRNIAILLDQVVDLRESLEGTLYARGSISIYAQEKLDNLIADLRTLVQNIERDYIVVQKPFKRNCVRNLERVLDELTNIRMGWRRISEGTLESLLSDLNYEIEKISPNVSNDLETSNILPQLTNLIRRMSEMIRIPTYRDRETEWFSIQSELERIMNQFNRES